MGRRPPIHTEKPQWVLHGGRHPSCCRYNPGTIKRRFSILSSLKGWAGSEPHRTQKELEPPHADPMLGDPQVQSPVPWKGPVLQPGVGVCDSGGPAASAVVPGGAGSPSPSWAGGQGRVGTKGIAGRMGNACTEGEKLFRRACPFLHLCSWDDAEH